MKSNSAKGCIDPCHFWSGFPRAFFRKGHEHSAPTSYMGHMTQVTIGMMERALCAAVKLA